MRSAPERISLLFFALRSVQPSQPLRQSRRLRRAGLLAALVATAWVLGALCPRLQAQAPSVDDLHAAQMLLDGGRLQAAADIYVRFLAAHPDWPQVESVALGLAEISWKLGDGRALERYREFVRRHSYADVDGRARYGLAECLFADGDVAGAEAVLREMLSVTPDAGSGFLPRGRLRLAWCRYKQGDLAEAQSAFQGLAAVFAGTELGTRARLGLAACRLGRGEYDAARRLYDAVVASSASSALRDAARLGGACAALHASQDLPAATRTLEWLTTSKDPRLASTALLWLGRARLRQGARGAAADSFRALADGAFDARLRGLALAGLGEVLAGEVLPPPAGDDAGWFALGLLDAAEGRLPRALTRFDMALQADLPAGRHGPKAAFAAAGLWYAALCAERAGLPAPQASRQAGLLAEAAARYERGFAEHPRDPRAVSMMLGAARCRARLGQAAAALEHLARLRGAFPSALTGAVGEEAALLEGVCLLREGKPDDAEEVLDELAAGAARRSFYRTSAMLWRARAVAKLGRFLEAAAELRTYLDEAPAEGAPCDRSAATLELAEALARAGRIAEAGQAVLPLLDGAKEPSARARPLLLLGMIDEWRRRPADALARYDAALSLPLAWPADRRVESLRPVLLLRRAACLYAVGSYEPCLAAVSTLAQEHPDEALPPETYAWAALDAWEGGRDDRVIACAGQLIAHHGARPEAAAHVEQALFLLARAHARRAEWPLCAAAARRLLRDFADSRFRPHAELDLAEALLRTGGAAQALEALRAAALGSTLRAAWLRAEALAAEGRPADAVRAYRDIVQAMATDRQADAFNHDWRVRVYTGLARAERSADNREAAIAAYRRAVRASPGSVAVEALRLKAEQELNALIVPTPPPPTTPRPPASGPPAPAPPGSPPRPAPPPP